MPYRTNIDGLKGLTRQERTDWENEHNEELNALNYYDGNEQYKDRIYRNILFKENLKPKKPIFRYVDKNGNWVETEDFEEYKQNSELNEGDEKVAEKQLDTYNKQSEEYENYKTISNGERDRIFADKMFENTFSTDSNWENLKGLEPEARDDIYRSKHIQSDYKYGSTSDDTRSNIGRNIDKVFNTLRQKNIPVIPEVIEGGKSGAILGGIVGISTRSSYGVFLGSALGGIGLGNLSHYSREKSGAADLEDAIAKSNELRKTNPEVIENANDTETNIYDKISSNEITTDYIDEVFNEIADAVPEYKTFKTQFDNFDLGYDYKIKTMALLTGLASVYGQNKAMETISDDIKDQVSDWQAEDWGTLGRIGNFIKRGFTPKFVASTGHRISTVSNWVSKEARIKYPLYDNTIPYLTHEYWDNVDKLGIWSPELQEQIQFGTNTDEYKDFAAEKKEDNPNITDEQIKKEWIDRQLVTGNYKGTQVSPFKRVRKTGTQFDRLSWDSAFDALEMTGYIADQMLTTRLLLGKKGKGGAFGFIDRYLGKGTRALAMNTLKGIKASGQSTASAIRSLYNFQQKLYGLSTIGISSIPISAGYAMQTYDDTYNEGIKEVKKLIANSLQEFEAQQQRDALEYSGQLNQDIENYYNQLIEDAKYTDLPEEEIISRIEKLIEARQEQNEEKYNEYIKQQKKEKEEKEYELMMYHSDDIEQVEDIAASSYRIDYAIEFLRNVGIDSAFRGWIYKPALDKIKGARVWPQNVEREWGYRAALNRWAKQGEKTVTDATGKTSVLNRFNKVKNKIVPPEYVEELNDKGELVFRRNSSRLRDFEKVMGQSGKTVWGGFWSNWMDDVTVAFSKGYSLNKLNNYIANKYSPDDYVDVSEQLFDDYFKGLTNLDAAFREAGKSLFDRQSLHDGWIGALGSLIGVQLHPLGIITKTTDENSSIWEHIDRYISHPLITNAAMVAAENRAKDARIKGLNQTVSLLNAKLKQENNAKRIFDTSTLISWLSNQWSERQFGEVIDIYNSDLMLGFRIFDILDTMNRESDGKSLKYKEYMDMLKAIANDTISEQDKNAHIERFKSDTDKTIKATITEDGIVKSTEDVIWDTIKENAKELLQLHDSFYANQELANQLIGMYDENISADDLQEARTQLAYLLTVEKDYKRTIEKFAKKQGIAIPRFNPEEMEGSDVVSLRSETYVEKKLAELSEEITSLEKEKSELEKKLAISEKHPGSFNRQQRQEVLASNYRTRKAIESLQEDIKNKKKELKTFKARASKYYNIGIVVGDNTRFSVSKKDNAESDLPVLSREEINALNPSDIAELVNHKNEFSEDQQSVIQSIIDSNLSKNPNYKSDIADLGKLYDVIKNLHTSIRSITKNAEGLLSYIATVKEKMLPYTVANFVKIGQEILKQAKDKKKENLKKILTKSLGEDSQLAIIASNAINELIDSQDLMNVKTLAQWKDFEKDHAADLDNAIKNAYNNYFNGHQGEQAISIDEIYKAIETAFDEAGKEEEEVDNSNQIHGKPEQSEKQKEEQPIEGQENNPEPTESQKKEQEKEQQQQDLVAKYAEEAAKREAEAKKEAKEEPEVEIGNQSQMEVIIPYDLDAKYNGIKTSFRNIAPDYMPLQQLLLWLKERAEGVNVYYYSPSSWTLNGNMAVDENLPIVAVVKLSDIKDYIDSNNINAETDLNVQTITNEKGENEQVVVLGVMPSHSKEVVGGFRRINRGFNRVKPIRESAFDKDNNAIQNKLLVDKKNNPISSGIKLSKVGKPRTVRPVRETNGQSLMSWVYNIIGFEPKPEQQSDIFKNQIPSSYQDARTTFLNRIDAVVKEGSSQLVLQLTADKKHPLNLYKKKVGDTKIFVRELDGTIKEMTIEEALNQPASVVKNVFNTRENNNGTGSRLLGFLYKDIEYWFTDLSSIFIERGGDKIQIEENEDKVSRELTNLEKIINKTIFINTKRDNIKVSLENGLLKFDIRDNKSEKERAFYLNPSEFKEILNEESHEDVLIDFIKNLLGTTENGVYKLDSAVAESGWFVNQNVATDYDTYKNSEKPIEQIDAERIEAAFDDGVLTVGKNTSIMGIEMSANAPFDLKESLVDKKEEKAETKEQKAPPVLKTESADNSSYGHVENTKKAMAKKAIEDLIKRSKKIKEKQAEGESSPFRTTEIAGAIANAEELNESNPLALPSSYFGNTNDALLRDILGGKQIDPSKYKGFSEELVTKIQAQVKKLKDTQFAGWDFYTDEAITKMPLNVKLENGDTIEIPDIGHTDAIAISPDGDIYIIDFKSFRQEDTFISKAFNQYTAQLNMYRNSIEREIRMPVKGIKIIPTQLDYITPDENDTYSQDNNGNLIFRSKTVSMKYNPETTGLGVKLSLKGYYKQLKLPNKSSANYALAYNVFKSLGFSNAEIKQIENNKENRELIEKLEGLLGKNLTGEYFFAKVLDMPRMKDITIKRENLNRFQREKLDQIIKNYQLECGKQESGVSQFLEIAVPKSENAENPLDEENDAPPSDVVNKEILDKTEENKLACQNMGSRRRRARL